MKTSAFMVGMASLKGGVGKSTSASLLSSHIWYHYPEIKTAIWDLDQQLSLYYLRSKDIFYIKQLKELLEQNPSKTPKKAKEYVKMYETGEKNSPLYPIRAYYHGSEENYESFISNPDNPIDYLRIKDMEKYDNLNKDIIFVDFPGTVKYKPDMQNLLLRLNALIIPVSCDQPKEIDSQLQYCNSIKALMNMHECNFEGNVYILWTRADKSLYRRNPGENEDDWVVRVKKKIKAMQDDAGFPFPSFESVIPDSAKIKDDTFQTILPLVQDSFATASVELLAKEFFKKVFK